MYFLRDKFSIRLELRAEGSKSSFFCFFVLAIHCEYLHLPFPQHFASNRS